MLFPPPATSPSRLAVLVVVLVSALFAASPAAPVTSVHAAEGTVTDWTWPVDGPRMRVRPYLAPATPYSAGHRGIDIGSSPGAAVLAPADGVVHFAGVVVDRPVLSIRHSGGLISSFEPVTTELAAGDSIRRGEKVGQLSGGQLPAGHVQASHCSRPCLHFGVRLHGEYLSPFTLLGGIPHSVLLPTRPLR